MKKNSLYKPMSHRLLFDKKENIENVGKETALRFFISLKEAPGPDTLEGVHRASWRRYLGIILVPIFFGLIVSTACADTPAAKPQASEPKMMSKEGEIKKLSGDKKTVQARPKTAKELQREEELKKAKVVEKTVTGTVMFIRKNRMSVEFASGDEGGEDMLLSLDKNVKVKQIKDFSKIKQLDKVQVRYTETYLEPKEQRGEPVILDRVGTEITFLKSASPLPKASADDEGVFSG